MTIFSKNSILISISLKMIKNRWTSLQMIQRGWRFLKISGCNSSRPTYFSNRQEYHSCWNLWTISCDGLEDDESSENLSALKSESHTAGIKTSTDRILETKTFFLTNHSATRRWSQWLISFIRWLKTHQFPIVTNNIRSFLLHKITRVSQRIIISLLLLESESSKD